jgi:hypothetical protein
MSATAIIFAHCTESLRVSIGLLAGCLPPSLLHDCLNSVKSAWRAGQREVERVIDWAHEQIALRRERPVQDAVLARWSS